MTPEYVMDNYDDEKYAYALCKCPLPLGYAIKFPKILDGKVHRYSCVCEDCRTKVTVVSKSYGPEKSEVNNEKH